MTASTLPTHWVYGGIGTERPRMHPQRIPEHYDTRWTRRYEVHAECEWCAEHGREAWATRTVHVNGHESWRCTSCGYVNYVPVQDDDDEEDEEEYDGYDGYDDDRGGYDGPWDYRYSDDTGRMEPIDRY